MAMDEGFRENETIAEWCARIGQRVYPGWQRVVKLKDGSKVRFCDLTWDASQEFLREWHAARLAKGLYDEHDVRNLIIDALEAKGFRNRYAECTLNGPMPEAEAGFKLKGREFRVVIQWTNPAEAGDAVEAAS